jgi:hypothetical protein
MNDNEDAITAHCCASCGVKGGVSLKSCRACMQVKYCNAECQKNHWVTHKKQCKLRAAELHDDALFKDPPAKEDCPICFLPMPGRLLSCASLPPATTYSVPIYDFAIANEEFQLADMEQYYSCCGKSICKGCMHSFFESGNASKCPFCNADQDGKTDVEDVEEIRKRVEANDAASIFVLAHHYQHGLKGLQQDRTKAMELYARSAELGFSNAHYNISSMYYHEGRDKKKVRFHLEAAAMAGNEIARYNLGILEAQSGNMDRALKHWAIASSAGNFDAMHKLQTEFEQGAVTRESMNSSLTEYNNSCAEMRSEARDTCIRVMMEIESTTQL